jgi:hypothetical protein
MDGTTIVSLISVVAALFLAVRALRSHGLSFANKSWMAVAWAVIIAALALIIGQISR